MSQLMSWTGYFFEVRGQREYLCPVPRFIRSGDPIKTRTISQSLC